MLLLPLTSALPTALQRTERRSVASALLIQIALQRTERRSAASAAFIKIVSVTGLRASPLCRFNDFLVLASSTPSKLTLPAKLTPHSTCAKLRVPMLLLRLLSSPTADLDVPSPTHPQRFGLIPRILPSALQPPIAGITLSFLQREALQTSSNPCKLAATRSVT